MGECGERADVRRRRLSLRGVELHVVEAGPPGPSGVGGADGRIPVLLLHGFPDNAELWRHQISPLADAGHRVVAPDLRGFGASSRPPDVGAYRLPHLVGDVRRLLDALEIERVAVVGHDWGAALAWATASALPDRVDRLVALSVGHPAAFASGGVAQLLRSWYMFAFLVPGLAERTLPAAGWRGYRRWAWGGAAPGEDPDADRQVADLSRPGALTAGLNWYRANLRPSMLRGTGGTTGRSIRCPTMGIWSTRDAALTEAQMTGSARHVDGPWRYERIEGVDHWIPVHAPDRLSALLLDFLA